MVEGIETCIAVHENNSVIETIEDEISKLLEQAAVNTAKANALAWAIAQMRESTRKIQEAVADAEIE